MGTKVHCKSYFTGSDNSSMRNITEDSSLSSFPSCYGGEPVTNGRYCNGFMSGIELDGNQGQGKDELKQKILEHESVFKNQVSELHRLYRLQRNIMEDVNSKEPYKGRASVEPSCSSSIRGSEDARKQYMAGLPMPIWGYDQSSVLGIEVVSSSSMSCKKQNNVAQPNLFPFRSGSTSRDYEVLESRPSKVRKKGFDLELPANEYIDVEEEGKVSDGAPNGNHITDVQASASSLKRSGIGLYDLNEPVKAEEAVASSYDFHGRALVNGGFMDVSEGFLNKSHIERKASERRWLSHVNESGSDQKNIYPTAQGYHLHKLPLSSSSPNGGFNPLHHGTRNFLRDGHCYGLKYSDKINDIPSYNNLGPIASSLGCSHPVSSSSWFNSSWANSVLPWAKSSRESAQNTSTFDNSSRILQPSMLREENLGEQVPVNNRLNSADLNQGVSSGLRTLKGFYHGSGSGFKEPACYGFLDGSRNFTNGSSHVDSFESRIDINLNETHSKISSNKSVVFQDLNIADGNNALDDHQSPLCWLNSKPAYCTKAGLAESSYFHATTSKHLCCKNDSVIDLNQPGSSDRGILREKEIGENRFVRSEGKNIMIDLNLECEPDESISSEEIIIEKKKQKKDTGIRNCIDLNSCATEIEDPPQSHSFVHKSAKRTLEIDLEVPAAMESEDDAPLYEETMLGKVLIQLSENTDKQTGDLIIKNAAEIMIDMSSWCSQSRIAETSLIYQLHWFVDTIISHEEESMVQDASSNQDHTDEIDEFEAMTLQLQETKEDYMPEPFDPQINLGDGDAQGKLPNRPRARRGRHQRKNFQRDVLPGMTSLSRQEVTEDLHIFGGLMKATGHSWSPGLVKRNGGTRGRRRGTSVVRDPICTQQISNGEAGLEDRSLTGWGKTTRRPRRQRCPPTTMRINQTLVLT